MNYYNEHDKYAAQWLRNLIAAKLIPQGEVDERSIIDVRAGELRDFTQCHFFAGIGGWSLALRLAGWPEGSPIWTGSCPCQPFSVAGSRKGTTDERHLWPVFHRLIADAKPTIILGEQVASADGRTWLAGVHRDLEEMAFAFGASDLSSPVVGAPHIRQRLYWGAARLADANIPQQYGGGASERRESVHARSGASPEGLAESSVAGSLSGAFSGVRSNEEATGARNVEFERRGGAGLEGLGDAALSGSQGERGQYRPRGERHSGLVGFAVQAGIPEWNGPTVAVECSDGWRRVSAQPDAFPLANGVPARMGRLRAYGNAIVPQVAAAFIEAFLGACSDQRP